MVLADALDSLDFDWAEPNALGPTFLPRIQVIQRATPILWSDKQNAWLVTRYKDVADGLADARFSNHRMHHLIDFDRSGDVYKKYPNFMSAILRWIFNIDAPSHTRLRKLLVKPFSRSEALKQQDFAQSSIDDVLDQVEGRDSVDFINEIAMPFATRNLLNALGLSDAISVQTMLEWGDAIAVAFGTSYVNPDASVGAEKAIVEITEVLGREIALRQKAPRDDLLSQLIQISEDGDRLSEEEIVALFHVLLLAGFETSGHTLTNMVISLAPLPGHVDYIRSHPERINEIVDELQRHIGLVGAMSRIVSNDMEWRGQQLRTGDMVYFMLSAANWDEEVFDHPEVIDFEREKTPNMVFSPGLHHCLGHNLAKVQLAVALQSLYRRFERIEILNPTIEWTPNFLTRSSVDLHVRFHR